jgi:transposase
MEKAGEGILFLEGPGGKLPIKAQDKLGRQLAMLFEGKCLGLSSSMAAEKYGYTKQRYYQLLSTFEKDGTPGLMPKKTGPKTDYVRTHQVVTQILRHRFLDPDASVEVLAQKMHQTGLRVSTRSIERTITEYGLQKKTPISSVHRAKKKRLKRTLPKSEKKWSK